MGKRFVTRRPAKIKVRRGCLSFLWIFLRPLLIVVPLSFMVWSIRTIDEANGSIWDVGTDDGVIRSNLVGSLANQARSISAIILTYKSYEKFERLLLSILQQKPGNFELIIADSGCLPETQAIISRVFGQEENKWLSHKYLQLCHNPGYAVGNNEAVKLADRHSEWVLFLNDDIVMKDENFITSMLELGTSKRRVVGAVGCTLRSIDGNKLQESGSIVWSDGVAAGYGRGRTDLDASDLNYPHPVDYVSGACILVKKDIFESYGGFDHATFPNYYEDTDLQMHIQHDLRRQVWLQPKAIALHDEHGSFGASDAVKKMEIASVHFSDKWRFVLKQHLANPRGIHYNEVSLQYLRAADLRARNQMNARIMYLHLDPSNPLQQAGTVLDRVYENLSMMVALGHRITMVLHPRTSEAWCDDDCRDGIRQMGVELVLTSWEEHFMGRLGFYDIVLVSRESTFRMTYSKLRHYYRTSSFVLIYDCEALWYRHDDAMALVHNNDGIQFPSLRQDGIDLTSKELITKRRKDDEIKLLGMADIVLVASENDEKIILEMHPGANIHTIVPTKSMRNQKQTKGFQERNGILFAADFDGNLYEHGDAIWYFLTSTYPLVLKESSPRIPLTIAGRNIPDFLLQYVRQNDMASHVKFLESPENLDFLYESHRIAIFPHLYGSSIQYKLREAMSSGIPIVVSDVTAKELGVTHESKVGCTGSTPESFKDCILSVHQSKTQWESLRESGRTFMQRSPKRSHVKQKWATVISMAKNIYKVVKIVDDAQYLDGGSPDYMTHNLFSTELWSPQRSCPEGESLYRRLWPEVDQAIEDGELMSAFVHWRDYGRKEGRSYLCGKDGNPPKPKRVRRKPPMPKAPCPEGETDYFKRYPDVKQAVGVGALASAFTHWEMFGRGEGRQYRCFGTSDDNDDNENDYKDKDKGKATKIAKGEGAAHHKQKKN